jgi:hypothetical protein
VDYGIIHRCSRFCNIIRITCYLICYFTILCKSFFFLLLGNVIFESFIVYIFITIVISCWAITFSILLSCKVGCLRIIVWRYVRLSFNSSTGRKCLLYSISWFRFNFLKLISPTSYIRCVILFYLILFQKVLWYYNTFLFICINFIIFTLFCHVL